MCMCLCLNKQFFIYPLLEMFKSVLSVDYTASLDETHYVGTNIVVKKTSLFIALNRT